jgi:predicted dehydrogenase
MHWLNRRDFLKDVGGLAAVAAGASLAGEAAGAQAGRGANERINVACVGVNGQGAGHVRGYAGRNNCVVTHICDVDSAVVGRSIEAARKAQGTAPEHVVDIRRLLQNKDIHVVSIATPNHWHALAAIWAMQAGKDVYVEKPVSHNVSEGRRIVEVARKTNKICQTGTQIRSGAGIREAIEFVRSGKLGKVRVARGLCYKLRDSIGQCGGPQSPPKTMDYDLWCGPAPNNPPHRNSKRYGPVHYEWHWIWDYGNGDLGNQGIHQMDVARWALGKNELAPSAISVGGRFGYVDDGQTPNTQICVFDYGDCELIFEVRGRPTKNYRGAGVGNVIHCTDGSLVFPSYSTAIAYDQKGEVLRRFGNPKENVFNQHIDNFIAAVRSRRMQDLHADILEGHLSSALCHLGNISYRLGQPTPFNGRTSAFGDNREAAETFARMQEHLRDNRVPLDGQTYRVGRRFNLDVANETILNDAQANRMLTREYRQPFVVPERA